MAHHPEPDGCPSLKMRTEGNTRATGRVQRKVLYHYYRGTAVANKESNWSPQALKAQMSLKGADELYNLRGRNFSPEKSLWDNQLDGASQSRSGHVAKAGLKKINSCFLFIDGLQRSLNIQRMEILRFEHPIKQSSMEGEDFAK